MAFFTCENCGFVLDEGLEAMAQAIKNSLDLEGEEELPESVSLGGSCPECGIKFSLSGAMFTHYINTRIDEGPVDVDERIIETIAIVLTKEQKEHLEKLTQEKRLEEVDEYIRLILKDNKPDDDDDDDDCGDSPEE